MGKPVKAIRKDGKVYRMRRGKLVEVPPEWVGQTTARQTIDKRPSKSIHKLRKIVKYGTRARSRKVAARATEEKEARQQVQEKE